VVGADGTGVTGQVVHLAEGLSEKVAQPDPVESSGGYAFIGQLDKSKCKNDGGFLNGLLECPGTDFKVSARELLFL
jgi:hypothetical protein